jgi:hypothetical protein
MKKAITPLTVEWGLCTKLGTLLGTPFRLALIVTGISGVARRHGVARGFLTIWRRQLSSRGPGANPKLCRGEDRSDCRGIKQCSTSFRGIGRHGNDLAGGKKPGTDRDRYCRRPDPG